MIQRYPNINLDDFLNQTVYVKFKWGGYKLAYLFNKNDGKGYGLYRVGRYEKDGTFLGSGCDAEDLQIEEIYGEDSYQIVTKEQ
jgi:hypothetical protein